MIQRKVLRRESLLAKKDLEINDLFFNFITLIKQNGV